MKYHIKIKEAFNVIGLELKTTSKRAEVEIGQLWHKFVAEKAIDKIPNITDSEPIALYYNYGGNGMCCSMGPDSYSYLLGYQVSNLDKVPVGMTGKKVPEQTYAIFTITGELPESIIKAWHQIRAINLKRTFLYDFELYKYYQEPSSNIELDPTILNDQVQTTQEVDIYVGIENG
jgi:predicted transcriptional regulator YdeE